VTLTMARMLPHERIDSRRTASIYLHFPYCTVRCRYCDFNVARVTEIPRADYTAAVRAESDLRLSEIAGRDVLSIYFGGGTPSLWGAAGVAETLAHLVAATRAVAPEVTLEANPNEAADGALLAAYVQAGITRLSLGLQAVTDAELHILGRSHDAPLGLVALDVAVRTFPAVTVDLIFGLPGSTAASWRDTLVRVLDTGVDHLSLYHLTVEPRTGLERAVQDGRLSLPTEDVAADQWELIEPTLASYGLRAYEISSYCRPGFESLHNTGYWLGQPYLGLGAGAHSFSGWRPGGARRRENLRPHKEYLRAAMSGQDPVGTEELVSRDDHRDERVMTGLRYGSGVDLEALGAELELDASCGLEERLAPLQREGVVEVIGGRLRLTPRGRSLADAVTRRLLAG